MGRNAFAYIAGIMLAIIVVGGVEYIGHQVYPIPPDLDFDPANEAATRAYIDSLPIGAILTVAVAWWLGAFSGSVLAIRTGTQRPRNFAIVVSGMIFGGGIVNIALIPHPLWFTITALAGIVVVAVAATYIGAALRPERPWVAASE